MHPIPKISWLSVPAMLFMITIQAQQVDSLKNLLKNTRQDTAAADRLNEIASYYHNIAEEDSCQKYGFEALSIVKKLSESDAVQKDKAYALACKKLKAKALENIGAALYYINPQAGFDTLQVALKLWIETGDKYGLATVYDRLGGAYTGRQDYENAIKNFRLGLNYSRATGNKTDEAMAWYNIGLIQRYMGNYGDALESNLVTLQIGREIKDTTIIGYGLLGNGFDYMFAKDYDEAIKNQREALAIFIARKDSASIATAYNDMGVAYHFAGNTDSSLKNHLAALAIRKRVSTNGEIGASYNYISDILVLQKKYAEALSYCLEGLKHVKLDGDSRFILNGYTCAGNIYRNLHEYPHALTYYDSALNLSKAISDKEDEAVALQGIANVYLTQGKNKEAIGLLNQAASVLPNTNHKMLQSVYRQLADAYVKTGDYKNAYENQVRFKQMSDSLTAAEKAEKITSLTKQLEYKNKHALQKASQEKQLAIQQSQIERQKIMGNISIAGLVAVIGLAIIVYIRFREKRKLNVALEQSLTELKATQTQLVHSEKMASLGELTAGIAHEIQNPLNFVNNFSDLSHELCDEMNEELNRGNINEAKALAGNIQENLEKVVHHGKRAESIVKGMLQHSRTSTGQRELTDINKLADEYLRLSYHGLRAKDKSFNSEIKTDFDEKGGSIKVVAQDIGRVLLNLYNNAFFAVFEKKQIAGEKYQPIVTVSTKRVNNAAGVAQLIITISDNGMGIPKRIVDKIFQPFFTTKPSGQGTGLGLSLSYDIIKAHKGEIKVETVENEGTSFIIQLPVS